MADSDDEDIHAFQRRRRRRVRASFKPKNMLKTSDNEKQRQEAHPNLFGELNVEDPEKFRQLHQFISILEMWGRTSYKQGKSCHKSTSLSSRVMSDTLSLSAMLNSYFKERRMCFKNYETCLIFCFHVTNDQNLHARCPHTRATDLRQW